MSSNIPRQAMILAAGQGKRMRPLTDHLPKPMIEVAGKKLIDYAIDNLARAGVNKLVVNSSYKAEILEDYLSRRAVLKPVFSREPVALETGGGIAQALHHFDNAPFFAVNGDVIWVDGATPALSRLAQHFDTSLDGVLLLHPRETALGFEGPGDFFMDAQGHLARRGNRDNAPYVYAGVQLLHPRLFEQSPEGAFSLNLLYDRALAKAPARIRGVVHDGAWLHVGDPAGRTQAEAYLLSTGSSTPRIVTQ